MRVLFLTHRLPYAPNRGDRIRAYHIVRALSRRFDVDVVSLVHDRDEHACAVAMRLPRVTVHAHRVRRYRNACQALASWFGPQPLTHALLDSRTIRGNLAELARDRRPEVVVAYCSGMARFALEPPLTDVPLVLDMVDVDSMKWAALARDASWPMRWVYEREARTLAPFESRAAQASRVTLVVNRREAEALAGRAPGAPIVVASNGIDLRRFTPPGPPAGAPRVVFCGVMNYGPNVDAACWLAEAIWPLVRAQRPNARLVLLGASPSARVNRLARDPSIEVTGTVPDVRDFLWSSAIAVAPLRVARGIQNKVLEALAAGLPVVVTPAVAQGLPHEANGGYAVADTPDAFARAVVMLIDRSATERRHIASRARLERLTWDEQLRPLVTAVAESGAVRPRAA